MIKKIALLAFMFGAFTASAQTPWLHLYVTDKSQRTETTTVNGWPQEFERTYGKFYTMPYEEADSIYFKYESNGSIRMYLHCRPNGRGVNRIATLTNVDRVAIGAGVPTFRINIPSQPDLAEVKSKEDYLDATLEIDGMGLYEDFSGEVKVRGRGNSTWNYDKKAYRLKLPEKTKLLGYRKAKNYVLLANRLDLSFMRNEVACLASQYAGCDFPTHATPVNVYFNNKFKGSYMLIEKVGINNGSVNMPKEQEAISCMFQLDVSYDEELKVKTPVFNLPLMHKDPDIPEDVEPKQWFNTWTQDFYEMESAVAAQKNVGDYLDYESLAKYLFIYNLTCNQEINHPKSIYMYKTQGDKWKFGPAWDFDWAFGYKQSYQIEAEGQISREELDRMHNEAVALAKEKFGSEGWGSFTYNGVDLFWTGYSLICFSNDDYNWPYMSTPVIYEPTYTSYLLGVYKNNSGVVNGDYQLGNGGEFFMSMIKGNEEFMEAYKKVWDEFSAHIEEFWADFDAYAAAVEPSAANDATIWYYGFNQNTDPVDSEFAESHDGTHAGAVRQLREWLKKRLEFIGNPENNYGLYNPKSTYKPGTLSYK